MSFVKSFTKDALPDVLNDMIFQYFPVNEIVYLVKNDQIADLSLERWYEIYRSAKSEVKFSEDSKKLITSFDQWQQEYKKFVQKYSKYAVSTNPVDFFVDQYTDSTVKHYTYGSELYLYQRRKLLKEAKQYYPEDDKFISYLEEKIASGLGDISDNEYDSYPPDIKLMNYLEEVIDIKYSSYNTYGNVENRNIILFDGLTYEQMRDKFYSAKEITFSYDTHQFYTDLDGKRITEAETDQVYEFMFWRYPEIYNQGRNYNPNYWIYWFNEHGKDTKIETIRIEYQSLEDVVASLPLDRKTRPPNLKNLVVVDPTSKDLDFILANAAELSDLKIELIDPSNLLEIWYENERRTGNDVSFDELEARLTTQLAPYKNISWSWKPQK